MKKRLTAIIAAVALLLCQSAKAQEAQMGIFNHVSLSAGIGLDGYGLEVAAPITSYLALRAGISALPHVKYKFDVDIDSDDPAFSNDEVEVEGKLNKKDWKVLLDIYPFGPESSFRLTGGLFIGPEKLIEAYNTSQFLKPSEWGTAGVKLGDYRITSDEFGNVRADIKVKKVKPYVGIGVGRNVPKKRLSVTADFGVQFWGKPGVYTKAKDSFGDYYDKKLEKGDFDDDDADKAFDIMSKITVYPVISIRLCGRIF